MPIYMPELYCQEVWDLGSAVDKLNTYLRTQYWEICDPAPTRVIYKVLRNQVNNICAECNFDEIEDIMEEDLFIHYSQARFNKMVHYINTRTIQFPHRDVLLSYIFNVLDRLRDFNNWFETPHGQAANWHKVHHQFVHDVVRTWWNGNEIMNFLPDDEEADEEQHTQQSQQQSQPNPVETTN